MGGDGGLEGIRELLNVPFRGMVPYATSSARREPRADPLGAMHVRVSTWSAKPPEAEGERPRLWLQWLALKVAGFADRTSNSESNRAQLNEPPRPP